MKTRYCDSLRQPCPNPHQCATDCHFNTAEITNNPSDDCKMSDGFFNVFVSFVMGSMLGLVLVSCALAAFYFWMVLI